MRESQYQANLIKEIQRRFPGSLVLKNDSALRQGIPDLTILLPYSFWAVLEVKVSAQAPYQPNQEHYLNVLGEMSFTATIYPENEEAVLNALQQSFENHRAARFS